MVAHSVSPTLQFQMFSFLRRTRLGTCWLSPRQCRNGYLSVRVRVKKRVRVRVRVRKRVRFRVRVRKRVRVRVRKRVRVRVWVRKRVRVRVPIK